MIIYFDLISGVAGDMLISSLVHSFKCEPIVDEFVKKIELNGLLLNLLPKVSKGISGLKFKVEGGGKGFKNLEEISNFLNSSFLPSEVVDASLEVFQKIASAESKIHNIPESSVHFHEVGGIDTVIDVTLFSYLLFHLKPEKVYFSYIPVSQGTVRILHGLYPAPAPASVELLKELVIYGVSHIEGENITPTGVALLSTFGKQLAQYPEMKIMGVGYGVGDREFNVPNVLRAIYGEEVRSGFEVFKRQRIVEANIDDSSSESLGFAMEKLFEAGAKDCFFEPIYMKKSRPAYKISVLIDDEPLIFEKVRKVLFTDTSTIGVRSYQVDKVELERNIVRFNSSFGEIFVKVWEDPSGKKRFSVEYEDIKRICLEKNLSFSEVSEKLNMEVFNKIGG